MRVVLAYAGTADDTCAIAWLAAQHGAEVIAVTLDIGQDRDPGGVRDRALEAGALRAHVIDARDEFAREALPALQQRAFDGASGVLAYPLIARKLVEVAGIERASALAHASSRPDLHEAIASRAGDIAVLAPVAEWTSQHVDPRAFAREHGVHVAAPSNGAAPHHNLLIRRVPSRVAPADVPAHVAVAFGGGVPVAINGVALALPELIDSLSLIAGQHGIAAEAPVHAPAADVLQAAYAALNGDSGEVHLRLLNGEYTVLAVHDRIPQLVNHA